MLVAYTIEASVCTSRVSHPRKKDDTHTHSSRLSEMTQKGWDMKCKRASKIKWINRFSWTRGGNEIRHNEAKILFCLTRDPHRYESDEREKTRKRERWWWWLWWNFKFSRSHRRDVSFRDGWYYHHFLISFLFSLPDDDGRKKRWLLASRNFPLVRPATGGVECVIVLHSIDVRERETATQAVDTIGRMRERLRESFTKTLLIYCQLKRSGKVNHKTFLAFLFFPSPPLVCITSRMGSDKYEKFSIFSPLYAISIQLLT